MILRELHCMHQRYPAKCLQYTQKQVILFLPVRAHYVMEIRLRPPSTKHHPRLSPSVPVTSAVSDNKPSRAPSPTRAIRHARHSQPPDSAVHATQLRMDDALPEHATPAQGYIRTPPRQRFPERSLAQPMIQNVPL
ncbi:uncharacterized protein B0I36DRAFT_344319 [Microdochium trichocladiopsis]|uniref:Uncharacterized protein n=1 Tax=Microdochium trichocladiopsis TaxID=1682393 RepID=A0A9P9BWA4_9PEZI|nr:uncharacterized protein B0I36DRAFT_344319 [Microdochium trichocladiopsis]KAH7040602.1 hypothetical protein B0I36DRAFT_344319 [Microdochium trichocladiopsis]